MRLTCVEEVQQSLDKRSFHFRQDELKRFVVLDTCRHLVQPGCLEQLLEEGRRHRQHHLVGGHHAVLALDVDIDVLLQI